jgi:luciferase family oxidoreductase group 1
MRRMIPLSILDLATVVEGSDVRTALLNTIDMAKHAERLGYRRFWLAEHHNFAGVASAATAVVIAQVALATSTIRVGAGGIMLPNHAPLMIAEQFGTLETLFPGRIDLGLGRAPGTDQLTARALRRTLVGGVERFPQDVMELMGYFAPAQPDQPVAAYPGEGADIPVWILGSSLFGAQLAAALGLPFAFASHFAPAQMADAVHIYRTQFEPSERLAQPYLMLGLNVVVAETDAEARRLYTSSQQSHLRLRTGRAGKLPPPVDDMAPLYAAAGEHAAQRLEGGRASVVGSPDKVRQGLADFVARYSPDEVIAVAQIYEHARRVRSFELLAQVRDSFAKAA